jgi:hypothetical protein
MKRKHVALLERFSAQFLPEQVATWERMIAVWDQDQEKPNPYEEPDIGELVFAVLCQPVLTMR